MTRSRAGRNRVGWAPILNAMVLLVGIVVLAAGLFSGDRRAFYAGLLITLSGVLDGVRRLTAPRTP